MILKIKLEKHNPEWKRKYKELKDVYTNNLSEFILGIEHVGSTAVEGLISKPVLDIDIIVTNEMNKNSVIDELEKLGYIHKGDWGIKGREAFVRADEKVPCTEKTAKWMKHNLYVCIKGRESLENHLRFRDYLRKESKAVKEYGKLKLKLVSRTEDINEYVEGKSEFIAKSLHKSGMNLKSIEDIRSQNKLK